MLVVSLGTNDPQDDPAGFRRVVQAVLREAGPRRCVVWSTIWLGGPGETLNDVLRAAAAAHGNLELADWAGLVQARPELVGPRRRPRHAGRLRAAGRAGREAREALPPSRAPAPDRRAKRGLLGDRLSWPACAGRICSSRASLRCASPRRASRRPARRLRPKGPLRVTFVGDSVAASLGYVPAAQDLLEQRGLRARLDLRVCRRLVADELPVPGPHAVDRAPGGAGLRARARLRARREGGLQRGLARATATGSTA